MLEHRNKFTIITLVTHSLKGVTVRIRDNFPYYSIKHKFWPIIRTICEGGKEGGGFSNSSTKMSTKTVIALN